MILNACSTQYYAIFYDWIVLLLGVAWLSIMHVVVEATFLSVAFQAALLAQAEPYGFLDIFGSGCILMDSEFRSIPIDSDVFCAAWCVTICCFCHSNFLWKTLKCHQMPFPWRNVTKAMEIQKWAMAEFGRLKTSEVKADEMAWNGNVFPMFSRADAEQRCEIQCLQSKHQCGANLSWLF